VLADQSTRYAPTEWARTAIALYRQHKADRIVAEVNNGGGNASEPHVKSRARCVFLDFCTDQYLVGAVNHNL
jgi:phage terminase large subunit-like protein